MRCRECNVDLSETYTKCPLCGSEACDDEPRVKGITPAPYPHGDIPQEAQDTKKVKTPFCFEKVKAFFNL